MKVKINRYYNGERVFSMWELSEILFLPKYEIKNNINSYNLKPTIIENRVGYYGVSNLCEFIEYLILKENLRLIKYRIKKSQT
ncbi:MAG: hypothetical protein ACSHW7_00590 [Patiriisocius sp.]|uniref:hypothetical protein n=1 Tax=Patiriisocius sp. TaxID=2822396 RepID=UPI003EF4ECF9